MNLGIFGRQTPFDHSVSEMSSYFENDQLFLESLKKALIGRASLERDYLASLRLIVDSLSKKLETVNNPLIKSSVFYICQDWNNLIEQSSKLANDFHFIATDELASAINKRQDFADNLKNHLRALKRASDQNVADYRKLSANLTESQDELARRSRENSGSMADERALEHLASVRDKDQKKLFRVSKILRDDKDKNTRIIEGLVREIEANQAELGNFFVDLGMKNFILQVNHLKNREYDINQLIDSFKAKHNNKFNYAESSLTSESGPGAPARLEFPIKLLPPNQEFMAALDKQFYKNVHHDLLHGGRSRTGSSQNNGPPRDYRNFKDEAVILSRLFDNEVLKSNEKSVIRNLYLKDRPEQFLLDFFKSFMKYKVESIYVKEEPMDFFLLEILEKILTEFIRKREYTPIFKIIKTLQFINIYTSSNTLNASISQDKSSKRASQNRLANEEFSVLSSQDFKRWIVDKSNSVRNVLSYKHFWVFALSQIFSKDPNSFASRTASANTLYVPKESNYVRQVGRSRTPPLTNPPFTRKNAFEVHQMKVNKFIPKRVTPPGQMDWTSERVQSGREGSGWPPSHTQNRSVNQKIMNKVKSPHFEESGTGDVMVRNNLLSCSYFVQNAGLFEEIVSELDARFVRLNLKKICSNLRLSEAAGLKQIFYLEHYKIPVDTPKPKFKLQKSKVSIFSRN